MGGATATSASSGRMTATVETVKENTKRSFIEPGKIALVGKSLSQLGDLKVGDSVTFDFVNDCFNLS